jgi:hypothetical protein
MDLWEFRQKEARVAHKGVGGQVKAAGFVQQLLVVGRCFAVLLNDGGHDEAGRVGKGVKCEALIVGSAHVAHHRLCAGLTWAPKRTCQLEYLLGTGLAPFSVQLTTYDSHRKVFCR